MMDISRRLLAYSSPLIAFLEKAIFEMKFLLPKF